MAGFFGFLDFTKEGDGLPEKPRKGLLLFLRIFKNNFWKLMTLNALFIAFSVPIVTIPASYTAMIRVLRSMADGELVLLWLDFWEAFKANFVQSLLYGTVSAVFYTLFGLSMWYFISNGGTLYFKAVGVLLILAFFVFSLTTLYIPLMIVSVKQRLIVMFSNAIRLSFIALLRNLAVLIINFILVAAVYVLLPYSLLFVGLLLFALTGFITTFAVWPVIKKYVIVL